VYYFILPQAIPQPFAYQDILFACLPHVILCFSIAAFVFAQKYKAAAILILFHIIAIVITVFLTENYRLRVGLVVFAVMILLELLMIRFMAACKTETHHNEIRPV
jgi:hypothetical protein